MTNDKKIVKTEEMKIRNDVVRTPKTNKIRVMLADHVEVYGKPGENMNSMVVGPPGCGKTFAYMLPTILCEDECSMVIDDKKGFLYNTVAEELRKKGYLVHKIDFTNFNGDFRYNCLQNVKTEEDMMRIADFMVPSQGKNVDRYWEMTAKSLLRCLLEIAQQEWRECLNLRRFMDLFNKCSYKKDEVYDENGNEIEQYDGVMEIISMHQLAGERYEAMDEYKRIRSVPQNTWNCTLNSLRVELMKYASKELFDITEETTFDFSVLGREKVALFIVSSDTDKAMYPMVQLMYRDIADRLIKFADNRCKPNEGRLPVHVRFLVDDFASGVQQIGFENIIANCRSRNISYMMGFQSISQLRALYQEHTNSIMDCINYHVFYSTTNLDTNTYLSNAMQKPVREIQQMNEETVCLIQRGKGPKFAKRVQTLQLPEYVQCMKNKTKNKRKLKGIA